MRRRLSTIVATLLSGSDGAMVSLPSRVSPASSAASASLVGTRCAEVEHALIP